MPEGSRLIPALDTPDVRVAERWARAVEPHCGMLKLGLEFFAANGPAGIRALAAVGRPIFLDLKLHDIPNTAAGALRSVLPLRPAMVTLHAAGGAEMLAAARGAVQAAMGDAADRPRLLAVTVLTSIGADTLAATGVPGSPAEQVLRLARLALAAGADGLVCSAQELPLLRAELGAGPLLVVPGIRPAGSAAGDQARVTTPRQAIEDGADWLVVGRPITAAPDPAAAARAIAADISPERARQTTPVAP